MNFDINLKVRGKEDTLAAAGAADTLSAALKSEERAFASLNAAMLRQQSGTRVDISLRQKQIESETRLKNLRAQSVARAIPPVPPRPADTRYGSTASGVLKLVPPASTTAASFREIKQGSEVLEALKAKASAAGASLREKLPDGGRVATVALQVVAVAAVALIATFTALGSKFLGLARDAITMGLGFADSARSTRLLNEAADVAGGTHKQLGGIIEDVRRRSDVGRERLGELARELRILRFDSRQTQVTLSAMATAESTLGSSASAGVQAIAQQSQAMRRFALGARNAYGEFESLRKIGLTKGDVFRELATASGRSIGDIQRSVSLGQISVTKGMTAIDAALRRKFGSTAQAQALSIGSQFRRFREDFEGLFSGSDMEPLLVGLKSISSIFSQDTASGRDFKEITTRLLKDVGDAIVKLTPDVKEFFLSLGAGAAGPGGLAESIRGWITDAKEFGATLKDVATAIKDIAGVAKAVGGAIGSVKGLVTVTADDKELARINKLGRIDDQLMQQGKVNGQALTAGIAAGIDAGSGAAVLSITGLSEKLKAAFKTDNEIKSPSRVYARESAQIPAGVGVGVQRGTPAAVEAVVGMSSAMQGGLSLPNIQALMGPRREGDIIIHNVHVTDTGGNVAELIRQIRMVKESGPMVRSNAG